jgi:hypothetical protein
MMFPKNGKRRKRGDLVGDIDRAFSEYVRLSYAGPNGIVRCFTCPTTGHWKAFDAGHFVDRRHMRLRWDRRNVRPQCPACNRYNDGHHERFARALDSQLGEGTADILERTARQPSARYTRPELEGLLVYYREQVRALKRLRGG